MLDPHSLHRIVSRSQQDGHGGCGKASKTILLVDDEQAVRMVARHFLESSGYRVVEAADGAEALRLFAELGDAIHMVLTDIVMPRMSGIELIARLRRQVPRLKALFVTGFAPDLHDVDLGDMGVATLTKPFTRGSLLGSVRAVLGE